MEQRPRISALPLRIQMADSRKLLQAPRLGATGRARGRSRQEARLRIWLRVGPHYACCGELIDITPGTSRPFELDHIVPLWQGGEDTDDNRQCLCVSYDAEGNKRGCHVEKTAREATERFRRAE
jgi:hypothetical protein